MNEFMLMILFYILNNGCVEFFCMISREYQKSRGRPRFCQEHSRYVARNQVIIRMRA